MNARRFATMTGNLLARKGEASPSVVPEDPDAHNTFNSEPLVKQTELRVMAFPRREREVEPATMHFEWPEDLDDAQPMHDLREYAPRETAPAKLEVPPAIEPNIVRPVADLRDGIVPNVAQPKPDLRDSTETNAVHPASDLRLRAEPEPARSEALSAERRSFFSESGGEKRHRMSLAMTQEEHERLGIVAVKKGLTRHQLMRDALDHYFEKLASDYKAECACIAVGGCRNACDTEET